MDVSDFSLLMQCRVQETCNGYGVRLEEEKSSAEEFFWLVLVELLKHHVTT